MTDRETMSENVEKRTPSQVPSQPVQGAPPHFKVPEVISHVKDKSFLRDVAGPVVAALALGLLLVLWGNIKEAIRKTVEDEIKEYGSQIEKRLDPLNARVDNLLSKVGNADAQLSGLDQKIAEVDTKVKQVEDWRILVEKETTKIEQYSREAAKKAEEASTQLNEVRNLREVIEAIISSAPGSTVQEKNMALSGGCIVDIPQPPPTVSVIPQDTLNRLDRELRTRGFRVSFSKPDFSVPPDQATKVEIRWRSSRVELAPLAAVSQVLNNLRPENPWIIEDVKDVSQESEQDKTACFIRLRFLKAE